MLPFEVEYAGTKIEMRSTMKTRILLDCLTGITSLIGPKPMYQGDKPGTLREKNDSQVYVYFLIYFVTYVCHKRLMNKDVHVLVLTLLYLIEILTLRRNCKQNKGASTCRFKPSWKLTNESVVPTLCAGLTR